MFNEIFSDKLSPLKITQMDLKISLFFSAGADEIVNLVLSASS